MMTLIALAVEMIVNVFLVIRNAVIRLLPAPEFVVVTVRGPLPERRPVSPARLRRWLGRMWDTPPPESLEEWRERLRLLAGDPRVRGIVLKLGNLQAGLASLEGLRRALRSFRASGKRLVTYLETCDLRGYYLASAAETVVARRVLNSRGMGCAARRRSCGWRLIGWASARSSRISPSTRPPRTGSCIRR